MNGLIITLIVLGSILLLTVLFGLCLPHIIFKFIFSRPKRTTKIPKFYIGTPHYIESQKGLKKMKTMESQDVYIPSYDGLKLHAYMFPCTENPKKFVLGIHGYRSYSRPEYAPYIEFYKSRGFSMLLPDDRAHGSSTGGDNGSEGDYIGFGVLDRFDCVSWAKYLVHTYGEDIQILLHGVSMGGATVLSASSEKELPKQVIGVVSDCAYSNGYDVLSYQLKTKAHIKSKWVMKQVEKILERKAGYNLHEHTPIEQIKNTKIPVFFIQGGKDDMVPPYMVKDLYNACTSKKRILEVPQAGHGESIAFAREEYEKGIIEHFDI